MKRYKSIACFSVVALAGILALGAKPSKIATEQAEISGDAGGYGPVGVNTWSYGAFDLTVNSEALAALMAVSPGTTIQGSARCLKKQGRFDFFYSSQGTSCDYTQGTCDRQLIVLQGIYENDRKTKVDMVTFDTAPALVAWKTGETREGTVGKMVLDFNP